MKLADYETGLPRIKAFVLCSDEKVGMPSYEKIIQAKI